MELGNSALNLENLSKKGCGQWPVFFWMSLDLVFLLGRTTSSGVFWGVSDLFMTLGNLSANGWGCVPVLLVVWHWVSSTVACWPLSGAGS